MNIFRVNSVLGEYIVDDEQWDLDTRYELHQFLGKGAYGAVCNAWDTENRRNVAIKKIADVLSNHIDALRILREIAILRRLKHPNIVSLVDILDIGDELTDLYVVFEFAGTDLAKYIRKTGVITPGQVKHIMNQLVLALKFMHESKVIHRDLKPANILINPENLVVKVADFGLSRVLAPDSKFAVSQMDATNPQPIPDGPAPIQRTYSAHVVTRWYRAPEVILTNGLYSTAIDIWSLGCIFAELLNMLSPNANRSALFPGKSCFPYSPNQEDGDSNEWIDETHDQLKTIFAVIGTPTDDEINRLQISEDSKAKIRGIPKIPPIALAAKYTSADDIAIGLLAKMLRFDASTRPSMDEISQHEYFKEMIPIVHVENVAQCLQRLDLEARVEKTNLIRCLEDLIRKEVTRQRMGIDEVKESNKKIQREEAINNLDPPSVARIFSDPGYLSPKNVILSPTCVTPDASSIRSTSLDFEPLSKKPRPSD